MLQKGNWLEPTMNGEPRFEKPPLPTWISAMMMAVFGQDNMALLRLPAVISGMLLIFFLYMLTREMTDDEDLPFLTAGTAASSFYILFMARDISWDIFCHSFMLGSIWLIHKNLKRQDQFAGYIGAGLLMGLSALSKGPIAFYALLLPYLLARGLVYGYNLSLSQIKGLALMTVIMLVLALWWPIYIYFSNPGHSWFVAQKESSAWLNRSSYPFYHYWSFPVQSGVWTIIAVAALVFPYAQKRLNKILNYKLIATWVWFSVLLLSLFPEKKERYLFPVMIPLAILTAAWFRYIIKALDQKTATRSDLFLLRLNSIVLSLICVIIPNGIFLISKGKQEPGKVMLFFITILLLFFAFLFIRTEIRKKPFLIWAGMTGLMMMTGLLIPAMSKVFQSNSSYHSYQELRHKKNLTDLPFFFNGVIEGKFIEVIWSSGHEIHYWNPLEKDLPVNPPFVFISHEQPYIILPPKILTNYNVRLIGHYDKNLQEERSQAVLSNYVSVIEPLNK
jgi:4-amino-4-deoxy-L-arabinose transferase-like glycosyltransferase